MLLYRILADMIVVTHFALVAFVVLAQVLIVVGVFRGWRWIHNIGFRLFHLLFIAVVVVQAWMGVVCPLTTLENHLRRKGGEAEYPGSFITYWIHELLFVEAEPWAFTICYSLFGLVVLASLFWAPPRLWRAP